LGKKIKLRKKREIIFDKKNRFTDDESPWSKMHSSVEAFLDKTTAVKARSSINEIEFKVMT